MRIEATHETTGEDPLGRPLLQALCTTANFIVYFNTIYNLHQSPGSMCRVLVMIGRVSTTSPSAPMLNVNSLSTNSGGVG